MQQSDEPHGVLSSKVENPNWFNTDSMSCTTCEHSEEEANIVKCSVEVNIDESDMDTSNNTKEDKATTMITFLRTVGTDYPHKLMST